MKTLCRCCHIWETFGKDGLCIRCRRAGCWKEPKHVNG